jgi:GT2 family glycosyltransferase
MQPKIGVVIPVGPGRAENLAMVLDSVNRQVGIRPAVVCLVCDGPEAHLEVEPKEGWDLPVISIHAAKHEPGMEQPRNIGVREIEKFDCTHVWFLDTDVIVEEGALTEIAANLMQQEPDALCCPYEWLPPGFRAEDPTLYNDPRWVSFNAPMSEVPTTGDLSTGLACFSGNLVWKISTFKEVGGFWNELHHGRCEDGELGLRAVAMGKSIGFCKQARGYHLWHQINRQLTEERNARDVPMLNERHPWVQGEGVFMKEEDGMRFDVECVCGWEGPTVEIFRHQGECLAERI